jgi:outer membrane protein
MRGMRWGMCGLLLLAGCATPAVQDGEQARVNDRASSSPVLEGVALMTTSLVASADTAWLADGDGPVQLTVEDALLLALQRNTSLQVARFQPLIADAFVRLERGAYQPELFADLLYRQEQSTESSRTTGERFSVEGEDAEATLGVRQRFGSGTEVAVSAGMVQTTSDRSPDQQEARLGLTMTQALLRGLGPAATLAEVRLAELEQERSRYELRGLAMALLAETETAYWRAVLAEEQYRILEQALAVARQQLDEVEQRIEVGNLPRNAAAAVRAEVARREQALVDAESQRTARRLRLAHVMRLDAARPLDPVSGPRMAATPIEDGGERVAVAAQLRPDLREAELRLAQREVEVVETRNGLLPQLDFFIRLGKTGYAESFGDAWSDLNGDGYDWTAGVTFSAELGAGSARARAAAAQVSQAQAEAALANMRGLVSLDVRLALNEVERARRQIEASALTRAMEAETVAAEQQRFEVGSSTSLLVAQAQRDLLLSELAEVEAVVDYRVALVDLYVAEGSLLERRGVTLAAE